MALLADGFLIVASLTACLYCYVLKRRLTNLSDLQGGIGATISQMTASIKDMEESFEEAKRSSELTSRKVTVMLQHADVLARLIERAEAAKISLEPGEGKAMLREDPDLDAIVRLAGAKKPRHKAAV